MSVQPVSTADSMARDLQYGCHGRQDPRRTVALLVPFVTSSGESAGPCEKAESDASRRIWASAAVVLVKVAKNSFRKESCPCNRKWRRSDLDA